MKKKSVLIFLLTAASAATLAVAGCKSGETKHNHSYSWQYTAERHWQECGCGDKRNENSHADVINNDTTAEGADGKCDVCGLANFHVKFNLNGHGAYVSAQTVYKGGLVNKPQNPEADGWIFGGWCTDDEGATLFDFTTPVTAELNLYAKWTVDERPLVTFVSLHGEAPAAQRVEVGGTVSKPVDLAADGWIFGGWCTDEEGDTPFNFDTPVTENLRLYAKWSVDTRPLITFVSEHGKVPASQRIEVGGTVTKPADLEADGWRFDGWFEDSAGVTPFDFTAPVTASTKVYAKWTLLAEEIEKDGSRLFTFGEAQELKFVFRAAETGRYRLSALNPNTQKCSFKIDLSDETVGGSEEIYFDLDQGKTVTITLIRSADTANDTKVGVVVNDSIDEPLPAEGWESGEYVSGYYGLTLDRNTKKVTWNNREYSFTYLGGKTDSIFFKVPGSTEGTYINYTVKQVEEGVLSIKGNNNFSAVLRLSVPQAPIPVSKFSGVYTAKGVDAFGNLSEIRIYANGNGLLISNGIKNKQVLDKSGASYDQAKNTLCYANFEITVNLDANGDAVSLNVFNTNLQPSSQYYGKSLTFTRVDDAGVEPPENLPVAAGTDYFGEKYSFSCSDTMYQLFNDYSIVLDDYNSSTELYKILTGKNTYYLKVIGSGQDTSIEVYEYGKDNRLTLTDTLTKYNAVIHDFPADGVEQTIASTEFKGNYYYYYRVAQEGYYQFSSAQTDLVIYYNFSENELKSIENAIRFTSLPAPVQLNAGTLIGVAYPVSKPANVKFSVSTSEEAKGTQSNPHVLSLGKMTVPTDYNKTYYAEFTAEDAGDYRIKLRNVAGDELTTLQIKCTINGNVYGFSNWVWYYAGERCSDYSAYKTKLATDGEPLVTLAAGEKTVIEFSSQRSNVTSALFEVRKDGDEPTELTLTDGAGSITASGEYKYTGFTAGGEEVGLTFECASDFTVNYDGTDKVCKTVTIDVATLINGFVITVPSGATVNYKTAYAEGTQNNPFEITQEGTTNIPLVDDYTPVWVKVSAPADKALTLSLGSVTKWGRTYYMCFEYNGEKYGYTYASAESENAKECEKKLLRIPAGESVLVKAYCGRDYVAYMSDAYIPVIVSEASDDVTIDAETLTFTAGEPVNGKKPFKATATVSGNKNFYIENTFGQTVTVKSSTPFTLLLENGTLTENVTEAVIPAGTKVYFGITGTLTAEFAYELTEGTVNYPYEITLTDGTYTLAFQEMDNFFKFETAGIYRIDTTGSSVIFNGATIPMDLPFTAKAGDIIQIRAYNDASITVKLTVEEKYIGDYQYTDGATKILNIGRFTITADGTEYKLIEQNGSVYTYKNAAGETVTVTYGETMLFGSLTLTYKAVFGETQVGEYSGAFSDGKAVIIELQANGKASYAYKGHYGFEYFNVICADNNGTFTFTYTYVNDNNAMVQAAVTFTFNPDGSISLTDGAFGEATLGILKAYSGIHDLDGAEIVITLTVNSDFTSGTYTIDDPNAGYPESYEITITENGGTYSYADAIGYWATGTFTVSGDKILMVDNFFGEIELTKK